MPPGDSRIFGLAMDQTVDPVDTVEDAELRESKRAAELLIKMDPLTSEESIYSAVRFWKAIADKMRRSGYPLFSVDKDESCSADINDQATELFAFLDQLLGDASDGILETDLVYQKLFFLIAQGQTLESFKKMMFELDTSDKCNTIWEYEAVAYRCNTCALTPCMSLCAPCFSAGNHTGHDFTRFFSREGGACDCGNKDVLRADGFCKRHRPRTERGPKISFSIVSLAEYVISRILLRLLIICRGFVENARARATRAGEERDMNAEEWLECLLDQAEIITRQTTKIVAFLQDCVNMGGPLRDAISEMLLDKDLYRRMTASIALQRVQPNVDPGNDFDLDKFSLLKTMPRKYQEQDSEMLTIENLLDELIFWIVRLTFPQALINFSLSMLSNDEYRNHFAYRFFKLYPCTVHLIKEISEQSEPDAQRNDVHSIACRVIHISVQMLSSEALCIRLDDSVKVIQTVLTAMHYLFSNCCVESTMSLAPIFRHLTEESPASKLGWQVIVCENNQLLATHGYWFVMGDLHNLLSHYAISKRVVDDREKFYEYFVQHIAILQGMQHCFRIISGDHREIEQIDLYQKAFTLEYETSATSMFNLIFAVAHLNDPKLAVNYIDGFRGALEKWFTALQYPRSTTVLSCHPFSVSFHIPLHRHLSTALTHFKKIPGMYERLENLIYDRPFLQKIILHPIRIQAVRSEYQNGMWIRNGAQIKIPVLLYAQPHISASLLMPDIDLIRFCAANLDPNWVWECILESFHLQDVFEWSTRPRKKIISRDLDDKEGVVDSDVGSNLAECATSTAAGPIKENFVGLTSSGQALTSVPVESLLASRAGQSTPTTDTNEAKSKEQNRNKDVSNFVRAIQEIRDSKEAANKSGDVVLSDVSWRGVKDSEVLIRSEWIDAMASGALKLIAQCIVMQGNWTSNMNEYVRNEIVFALAESDCTHSKLRSASIPEKGSRGIENIDEIFEEELRKVATFIPPDAKSQGRYRLTDSAWLEHFCPLFLQIRGYSAKIWNPIFNRLEAKEKPRISVENKQSQHKLWIPYRLISFENILEEPWTGKIVNLITCERFFEMSAIILKTCSTKIYLHDQCEQLIIYLLSLSLKYLQIVPEPKKSQYLHNFHKEWFYRKADGTLGNLSVFTMLSAMFVDALSPCHDFASRLRQELGSDVKDRITGTKTDYIARLFNLLYQVDEIARSVFDDIVKKNTEFKVAADSTEMTREMKRALAKERREQLLEQTKKKNDKTMAALMEKEGISQQEMDEIDTSQPSVRLYECPICGDTTPSTLNQPLGMLIQMEENDIVGAQVSSEEKELSLLDADRQFGQNGLLAERLTLRTWESARGELIKTMGSYQSLVEANSTMEMKTCGHCAHITCLIQYANTLHRLEVNRGALFTMDMSCPLCRSSVNYFLPIAFDFGFETSSRHKEYTMEVSRKQVLKAIAYPGHFKKDESEELAFISHYSESIDGILQHVKSHKEYTVQNHIAGLIKTNVERNLLQSALFPDGKRRKNKRIIVEHLMAALVARTEKFDTNAMLCATRDLFDPSFFLKEDDMNPTTSNHSTLLDSREDNNDFLEGVDNCEDIEMRILKETKSAQLSTPYDPIRKNSDVPLLLFDHRSLLVKLTAYVTQYPGFTYEEKLQLSRILAQLCHSAAQTRCYLQVLVRMTFEDAQKIAKSGDSLFSITAREFLNCRTITQHIFAESSEIMTKYEYILSECSKSNIRFVTQFWQEMQFKEMPQTLQLDSLSIEQLQELTGLSLIPTVPKEFIAIWVRQFAPTFPQDRERRSKVLSREPLLYRPSLLLQLPVNYDELFTRFFNRNCIGCGTAPSIPFICLLCSQLVCVGDCCKISPQAGEQEDIANEIDRHVHQYENGFAPFLLLNSSLIIIIKRDKGLIWGTVYLDAHGEEDRNLRRGKPLFLSEQRFEALQRDCVEKDFSQALTTWIDVSQLYSYILEPHHDFRYI